MHRGMPAGVHHISVVDVPQPWVAFYQRRNYGPERVAAGIMKAIAKDRALAPVSPEAWAMYLLKRAAPRFTAWLNRRMADRFQRQLTAEKAR